MEININEKDCIVEIWLTSTEKNNQKLRDSLKPKYKKWKAQNYLPVVYESGEDDLKQSIYGLLRHNREIIAKQQLSDEKHLYK